MCKVRNLQTFYNADPSTAAVNVLQETAIYAQHVPKKIKYYPFPPSSKQDCSSGDHL